MFDFTTIMDRHNKDAIAIDVPEGMGPCYPTKEGFSRIPMWVADMNFPTCPTIQKEMLQRIQHPAFGYFQETEAYYKAIREWLKTEKNLVVGNENIGYENGVLGGVVSALSVLCSKGDNVLLHSPTYIGFTGALENNGYHIIRSPLYLDEANIWRMDYKDMEEKITKYHIHVTIFCSPHNPCGRVWEKDELQKAMEIFEKHHVYVISDEIWSDLLLNGHRHIPTQTVNEYARKHTVSLYAPSKTFNLAGLVGAYHIVFNPWLKDRLTKESSLCHYNSMNVLWMHALIGAYQKEGHLWLQELKEVLSDNVNWACDFIENRLPDIQVSKPQGTYMLFIDCQKYCQNRHTDMDTLYKRGVEYGILWQDGRAFHGNCHIRLNLAVPKTLVMEAFQRMKTYVFI